MAGPEHGGERLFPGNARGFGCPGGGDLLLFDGAVTRDLAAANFLFERDTLVGDNALLGDTGALGGLARGDFRTLSAEQTKRVGEKMRAIVARHLPRTEASIEIEEHYPPMAPTPGNRALLARLNDVNRDLGLPEMGELDPLSRGAGDISFVAADVDGLAGMGVAGAGSHAAGESADLDSIPRQAKRAAVLMTRLSRTPR